MSPVDFGKFRGQHKEDNEISNQPHQEKVSQHEVQVRVRDWSEVNSGSRLKFNRAEVSNRFTHAFKKPGFVAWACLFGVTIVLLAVIALSASTIISAVAIMLMIAVVTFGIYRVYTRSEVPDFETPIETVLPDRGVSKVRYMVNRKFGRPDIVPSINKEQESDIFEQRIKLLEGRIRDIVNLGVHPNIWVGNQKGSSAKSVMAVIMGEILAEITRRIVVLLPSSTSTQTATAGNLAGVRGKTLTLRQYATKLQDEEISFHELFKMVAVTKHGLRVISEDTISNDKSNFSKVRWLKVHSHLRENAEIIISDTGNDDAYAYTVTSVAMRQSDVVVVAANRLMKQTLESAGATLAYYMHMQKNIRQAVAGEGQALEGDLIPVSEKLENAVVVMNAYDHDEGNEEFVSRLSSGIKLSGGNPSLFSKTRVFGVQEDDHLYDTVEGLDYTQMARATYFDYLVVIVAVFEQAALLQKVKVPKRHWLIKNVGIIMPSPS